MNENRSGPPARPVPRSQYQPHCQAKSAHRDWQTHGPESLAFYSAFWIFTEVTSVLTALFGDYRWLVRPCRLMCRLGAFCVPSRPYDHAPCHVTHAKPHSLAEWLGSFTTCYCGNTGVERIPKKRKRRVNTESWPWRRDPDYSAITASLVMMKCCLMSSDVSWHIRDKLWPMPKHGSTNLYVHGNQKAR